MKTVKVRIAVAVDHKGDWSACGFKGQSDDDAMTSAVELLEPGEARYFVNAELRVPEQVEVEGEVEEVK